MADLKRFLPTPAEVMQICTLYGTADRLSSGDR